MTVLIGAIKSKKIKDPKYTYGDMLYSYQNPDKPGRVFRIIKTNDSEYQHKYQLVLKDKDGYTYSSNMISENSLSKRKKK
jgi:hypothetical protein